MKEHKLTIKVKIKELIKKSPLKQIKKNKLFIRSMKKKKSKNLKLFLYLLKE